MKILYVISGCVRTFKYTIDSIFKNVVEGFSGMKDGLKPNIKVLLYLKLTEPGPKGQIAVRGHRNYKYSDVNISELQKLIGKYQKQFNIEVRVILKEISTELELFNMVVNRQRFSGFLNTYAQNEKVSTEGPKQNLIRSMYNFQSLLQCDKWIDEQNESYNWIVWLRPDLLIKSRLKNYTTYINNTIYMGRTNPMSKCIDHIAIIPFQFRKQFFRDRFCLYSSKILTTDRFNTAEDIYKYTLKDIKQYMDDSINYVILRENKGIPTDVTVKDLNVYKQNT